MKKLCLVLSIVALFSCKKSDIKEAQNISGTEIKSAEILDLVATFNPFINQLNTSPLEITDDQLKKLDVLSETRVIGLGESSHGTKEFFQTKHRLFQYFVKNFNHRVFAFEMDYGESLIIDDYIQTGNGDLAAIMKKEMHFWTWKTTEVQALIEWMKVYNSSRAKDDKLHLYGVDCQYFDTNARVLLQKCSDLLPSLGKDIEPVLKPLSQKTFLPKLADLTVVLNAIQTNKAAIIEKSSDSEYEIIEHIAEILIQTYNVTLESDIIKSNNIRDEFMGKNTVWLSKRTPKPMTMWAHNAHISKPNNSFDNNRPMGFYIDSGLQGDYKTIGFSFTEGSVTAIDYNNNYTLQTNIIPDIVNQKFSNGFFGKANYKAYFYKTSDVFGNNKLRNYINTLPFYRLGLYFFSNFGTTINDFPPFTEKNFDYIIHFNKSTHSDLL